MTNDLLAFIPARGGSKRVPGKNVRLLAGRPLVAWTVRAALDSGLFARTVVSSDDAEILAAAKAAGAETDARPANLATDTARNVEVLGEYLSRPDNTARFAGVALLPPTSPLRTVADLKEAADLWRQSPGEYVISITNYEFPPEFAMSLEPDGLLSLRHPERYAHSTQSQSVPPAFHPNGAITIGSVERFLRERTFYAPPMRGYLMPPERSFDLDYAHQFAFAESLLRQNP